MKLQPTQKVWNPDFFKDLISFLNPNFERNKLDNLLKFINQNSPTTYEKLQTLIDRIEFINHLSLVKTQAKAENYIFQGKAIFFIDENKFEKLKNKPSEYIKIFPTIIIHSTEDLVEKALVFSRFRIYRLAEIIMKQSATGKGLKNPGYETWKKRLGKVRR